MKQVEAACPSCGAAVVFKASSSLVTICQSCSSVVARGDRRLEDHGKIAAIVPTQSAFYIGQTGRFREHPFEIVGRVQYQHPAGGRWDEWYASFAGGRWCWISEAQGKRYFTQKREITSHTQIPAWEELQVGSAVVLGSDITLTVDEFNTAALVAAEGEVPFDFSPGMPHRFADLSGSEQRFATLVYDSSGVTLYRGREVTLAQLGIAEPEVPDQEAAQISGFSLSCPQCGGALELHAPDQLQRVTCPYCSSLLDMHEGNLKYLATLDTRLKPLIPLGTEGALQGTKFTVIGFVRRVVHFDRQYHWDEYLLYDPQVGFRWLVNSDLHWSFVEPVTISADGFSSEVHLDGKIYRIFQRAWASVEYVLGEFYWKVSVGETVLAVDYIAPPLMLTIELTPEQPVQVGRVGAEGWMETRFSERITSRGIYISHEQVEQAFSTGTLRRGAAIAPNQPAPEYGSTYMLWPMIVLILIGADIVVSNLVSHPVSHGWTILAIGLLSLFPAGLWLHSRSFESSRWADSEFSPYE